MQNTSKWIPVTKKEVEARGWNQLDVILFSGDAYIDHPSFGSAIVARLLENMGLKVAIVPQPNWQDDLRDFKKLGIPRLFFGVTGGSMDSMVNHYTANKRLRSNDAYTPGGISGFRPDYATITYSNILKSIYPDVPVIIGGVEASLRRVTHYDYWSDQLKPGILSDSKADLLLYGMAEVTLREVVSKLQQGIPINDMQDILQTAYLSDQINKGNSSWQDVELSSHEECLKNKMKFSGNFKLLEEESGKYEGKVRFIQKTGKQYLIINPSRPPVSEKELDDIYQLPFTRLPHPKYSKKGAIPAYKMIRHSITLHRGCFGACSFCTISAHQGKFISSRSQSSIIKEAEQIKDMPDFKGYISDLGGPSANMYKMGGIDLEQCKKCKRISCIHPNICKNLDTNPNELSKLYKTISNLPGVKKAFVGSGIRYDLFMNDLDKKEYYQYAKDLITNHVSGRLKVAPEHTTDNVLKIMRKPSFSLFRQFNELFTKINHENKLNQQLIPYFISSHPGSASEDMAELAIETKNLHFKLEQVQDFTPTPMTLATVMYYSGIDPYSLKKIYVAKSKEDKLLQQSFFFWYKSDFRGKIIRELKKIQREDFINRLFGKNSIYKHKKHKKRKKK